MPDCQACGACCSAYIVDLYQGEGHDIPHPLRNLLVDQEKQEMRRDANFRCAALVGKVGESVKCSIYGCRPTVCRDFPREESSCHRARRIAGVKPPNGIPDLVEVSVYDLGLATGS